MATDGQTGKRCDKQRVSLCAIYARNGRKVLSAHTLEVSARSRNGAPSRKGCVVDGQ